MVQDPEPHHEVETIYTNMIPTLSPYGLIQEAIWPNRWLVLVSCVLLNCTRRKQVEKVFPTFIRSYDVPERLLHERYDTISDLIAPLGFQKRRTNTLFKLAGAYLDWDGSEVRSLPGIGEYAARAWEIFVLDRLGDDEPDDGALKLYWSWRKHVGTLQFQRPSDR